MGQDKAAPNRIKQLREDRGWSQKTLADWLTINHSTVSLHETGKRMLDRETVFNYARVFGVRPEDIYMGVQGSTKERELQSRINLRKAIRDSITTGTLKDEVDLAGIFQEIIEPADHAHEIPAPPPEPPEMVEKFKGLTIPIEKPKPEPAPKPKSTKPLTLDDL